MREIKFRGQRVDNGEWVYGYYYHDQRYYDGTPCVDVFLIRNDCDEDFVVIPETVGQYTGQHDKNGKELYENEICELRLYNGAARVGVIEWQQAHCHFSLMVKKATDGQIGCHSVGYSGSAVEGLYSVSNIHENPELLEVK